jgi:DNA-binding CsgD family transcriptional regulator/PAS domain-containing protein
VHSEATLLRLVERIYDSALEPDRWPSFLELLAETLDGHIVNLAFTTVTRTASAMSAAARFDPDANRLYHEHFWRLDPWLNRAAERGLLVTGVIGLGSALVPPNEYEKTEFHNDFGKSFGVWRGGVSAVILADSRLSALLNASQRPGGRTFDQDDVLLLRRLLPHLQRAFQLYERLSEVTQAKSAVEDVIDRMPFGVVLLDGTGRVTFVNRAAKRVFDARDGLTLRNREVSAASTKQTTELHQAIAEALAAGRGQGVLTTGGGVLAVDRPSLKRPFQVLITPVHSRAPAVAFSGPKPIAALFVSDVENETGTPGQMLRTFYGLTPAESRLASELLQHRTVEEAAETLDISLNTARSQLKRLFEKTGTRRQSELLRLLAGGIAQITG